MNNQDLRVIKTRANIKEVFCKMLEKKPVDKITVTELAKQAKINKSTFYLHYQDIYALYNEVRDDFLKELIGSMGYCRFLLTDPEKFLKRFFDTMKKNSDRIDFLWPNHDIFSFQPNLNERIVEKLYQECKIKKCVRNDMILDTIIGSAFRLSVNYKEEPDTTMEILLTLIQALFPMDAPALSDPDA